MAICLTDYKIVITFADKTQKIIDTQAAQHLKLPKGAFLTLVETATAKPPAKLVTKQLQDKLVFELEGEGEITRILDTDITPAQVDYSAVFSLATQQEITGQATASSEICAPTPASSHSEVMTVGSWGFLGAGTAGAIGGAAALLSSKSAANTTVVARVVGGPVLPGNDLQATIYKADGVSVLGTGTIGADGTVTVSIGNYTGVVVVKVQNNGGPTDPDNTPDYMDEASGQGKDLGDAVLYSVGVLVQEGSTIYLNVNILTALAHLKATEVVGDGIPLDATTVRNSITAIANAFGLEDLTSGDIATTVTQNGTDSAQTANLYGEILAALSGADARNGGDTQQTLLDLAANIQVTGNTATLLATALEILIEGAKTADPSNTMGLVNTLSEATTLSSPSVSIGSVGGNNYINASEANAGVTVSGTCAAGASVAITLGSNIRTATVNGTSWSYVLSSSDFTAMGQGPETILVTSTLNGQSASASRGIYIDTVVPSAPTVDALLSNDTSPVITGSSTPSAGDERLTVTVNGATYTVTPNGTGTWSLDLGTATPASGSLGVLADGQTYQVVATVGDAAGNSASDTSTNELVIDTSAPSLAIDPVSGGYINNADDESAVTISGTSNAEDGRMVTVVLAGQSYTATVNSGTWSTSIPSDVIKALSAGTVTLTANVSDAAGNNALQATQSFVYDITAPATPATPSAYDDGVGTQQNASSTASTTDDVRPGLRVPYSLSDTLTLFVDGVSVDATYSANTGTLTPNNDLQDGLHSLTYTLTDAAGNVSLPSGAFNLTIDTTAPTAVAPTTYIDDVGTIQNTFSTAATTDDVRPGLRIGTNLTDTPKLYVDGVLVAATYDASTGTLTPNSNLAEGAHAITYTLTDAAGNESARSAALNVTVDTTAPSTPSAGADLPANADTGNSNSDNITHVNRPGLQVGALPAGVSKIDLLVDGQVVAAVYDAQTGLLQPASTLSDGTYALTYRYTDAAGNQSGLSPVLNLTIDTVAPSTPSSAPDLLTSDDSGASSSDNNTSNNRPVLQVGALPSGVTGIELLVGGQKVAATYDSQTGQIRANAALTNGVHAVTYRYLDLAGNASQASDPLALTVDTTAPLNAAITMAAAGGIIGTFEPGTNLALTIAGQAVTGTIVTNSNGTWQYVPTSSELTALRLVGTKELLLTATDIAGNTASDSKTVTADDFSGPYIKEYIPADGGVLANAVDGTATLNLVFSKDVVKGAGNIQLFEVGNANAIESIAVTDPRVVIQPGGDVYITLPGLTTGRQYYVTLAAGTFVDLAGEAFVGRVQTGTAGWDFTAAAASIAPNFVAGDDLINIAENAATVNITGKVVSSAAILADIRTTDLTVSVSVPVGNTAVTATVVSYSTTTGEFVFSVPASAWAEGTYRYTVTLAGTSGGVPINASYQFNDLGVDLTAPTMTASVQAAQDNVGSITGNVWASSNTALSDDTSPTLSGTISAPLSGDARVVVYRQDVTGTPGALVRVTDSEGLKPAGTTWSLTDNGLLDGHSYKYLAYVEDAAGNRSPAGDFKTLLIDTQAPQATVTTVSLSDDTGISATDLITNVANQTLTGTLSHALAGDEKLLASVNGGVSWLDITAAVNGTSITWPGVTLPEGSSSVLFKSVDPAGNEGTLANFSATLDTTAPNAPTAGPDLKNSEDSGTSPSDDITNNNRPSFDVGALPSGVSGVELLVNGQRMAATYVSGALQPTLALPDGNHTISYRYTDAAGNQSGASTALSLTVDTTAPSAPAAPSAYDDNTGAIQNVSSTASATDDKRPGLRIGTNLSDTPKLYVNNVLTAATYDPSTGTLTPNQDLQDGAHQLTYSLTDAAGNESGRSPVFNLTIDTTAPTPSFEVSTTTPQPAKFEATGNTAGADVFPRLLVLNANGDMALTWYGFEPGNAIYGAYLQRLQADGTAVGATIKLDGAAGSLNDFLPLSVALPNGKYAVYWIGYNGAYPASSIYIQIFNADGTSTIPRIKLDSPNATAGDNLDSAPVITPLGNTGDFLATWAGKNASTPYAASIYVQKIAADGTLVGAPSQLDGVPTNVNGKTDANPSVAVVDSQGSYVVTWYGSDNTTQENDYSIFVQKFNPDGTRSGAMQSLESRYTYVDHQQERQEVNPRIAALGTDGEFVVAWQGGNYRTTIEGYAVYVQKFGQDGNPSGAVVRLDGDAGEYVDYLGSLVVLGTTGKYAVAWEGSHAIGAGVNSSVYVQLFNADGTRFNDKIQIDRDASAALVDGAPAILSLGNSGDFLVSWYAKDATGGTSVCLQKFDASGTAIGSLITLDAPDAPSDPATAYDSGAHVLLAGDDLVVAWNGIDANGDSSVYVTRIGASVQGEDLVQARSTENGRLYLVDAAASIVSEADILDLADHQFNTLANVSASTMNNLDTTGLGNGGYKLYAIDAVGNFGQTTEILNLVNGAFVV